MGLDQQIKITFIKYEQNRSNNLTCGDYYEYSFHKNYFLRDNFPYFCDDYDYVCNDNCVDFYVDRGLLKETYDKAVHELKYLEGNTGSSSDFNREDLEEFIQFMKVFTDLLKEYPDDEYDLRICYWQWY